MRFSSSKNRQMKKIFTKKETPSTGYNFHRHTVATQSLDFRQQKQCGNELYDPMGSKSNLHHRQEVPELVPISMSVARNNSPHTNGFGHEQSSKKRQSIIDFRKQNRVSSSCRSKCLPKTFLSTLGFQW